MSADISPAMTRILEGVRVAGVTVSVLGVASSDSGCVARLVVGVSGAEVVLFEPGAASHGWTVRMPVRVRMRRGTADPGGPGRLHHAALARPLRAAGFQSGPATVTVDPKHETFETSWERTASDEEELIRAIHTVAELETRIDPPPEDGFWESFGDLAGLRDRAARLPPSMTASVTPWAAAIDLPERPGFATLQENGGGRVHVVVVLPPGHGARAARRRAEQILAWFLEHEAPAWRAMSFGEPRLDGAEHLKVDGVPRWGVRIVVPLPTDRDEARSLEWAAGRSFLTTM